MLRKGKGTSFHVLLFDHRLLSLGGHIESRETKMFSFAPLELVLIRQLEARGKKSRFSGRCMTKVNVYSSLAQLVSC